MKGNYNEECNITSCQRPNSAVWFNHSTRKYYCGSCAKRLNEDVFNKRDAQEMFGHPLCTLEKGQEKIGIIDSLGSSYDYKPMNLLPEPIQLEEPKSGRENRRERRKQQRKTK